jgi:hypothetical protein
MILARSQFEFARHLLFPLIPAGCINLLTGHHRMARGKTHIGAVLLSALVFLLLCGIVAGEFPELLSLTDNPTNDFTFRRTHDVALPALTNARRQVRAADTNLIDPASDPLFSRLGGFQKAVLFRPPLFILHTVLRT